MDYLQIKNIKNLTGNVSISGAKNSSLPLIALSILSDSNVNITNVPQVADIKTLLHLLEMLGATYTFNKNDLNIDASSIHSTKATYDIVKTMRASILTLGPLLSKFKKATISLPGGCAIGERPVDLHLKALISMGADISIKAGYIDASVKTNLKGSNIIFDKITVTGSENIIMAAAMADGKSTLINCAREPEVEQLCQVLKNSGIDIQGIGSDEITIYGSGGEPITIADSKVIPDRIEAFTYLCAGAIVNTPITLTNINASHISSMISKLEEMGFGFTYSKETISLIPAKKILPIEITTTEYPGFPTDAQAQIMVLATQADGTSIIEEKLFENRFMHVAELKRLGANIHLKGKIATINGNTKLTGTDVMATDLRASSALVLAGLIAKGTTNIHRIYHLDRGYEDLEGKLAKLGANITRKDEETN
jgi:UDP-N-acetylglucosamine 1-carboxyvinyltransferase